MTIPKTPITIETLQEKLDAYIMEIARLQAENLRLTDELDKVNAGVARLRRPNSGSVRV